jgi:hypothetical protein
MVLAGGEQTDRIGDVGLRRAQQLGEPRRAVRLAADQQRIEYPALPDRQAGQGSPGRLPGTWVWLRLEGSFSPSSKHATRRRHFHLCPGEQAPDQRLQVASVAVQQVQRELHEARGPPHDGRQRRMLLKDNISGLHAFQSRYLRPPHRYPIYATKSIIVGFRCF